MSNWSSLQAGFSNHLQPVVGGSMKDKSRRKAHRKKLRERFQRDFKFKRRCQGCLKKTKALFSFKKSRHKYWLCRECLIKAFNLRLRKGDFSIRKLGNIHLKGKVYTPRRLYRVSASQSPQPALLSLGGSVGKGEPLDNRARAIVVKLLSET